MDVAEGFVVVELPLMDVTEGFVVLKVELPLMDFVSKRELPSK